MRLPLILSAASLLFWLGAVSALANPLVAEAPVAEIAAVSGPFSPVDLSTVANRRLTALGGLPNSAVLTDQGENDLRSLPQGAARFLGIPFQIPDGGGEQAIVLRGQSREGFPNRVEVPVNARAGGVYFLHASAWSVPQIGTYRVVYADGAEVALPLRTKLEIFDWWSPERTRVAEVGWRGSNPVHYDVGLALYPWTNPHPEKTIRSIIAETPGDGGFLMLAGITLSAKAAALPRPTLASGVTDTAGWWAFAPGEEDKSRPRAIDLASRLDAPAGKHGFLKTDGERFVFENGTPVRFWGTNNTAESIFRAPEEVDAYADRIASLGYNMVRIHHLDAGWVKENIFDENLDHTRAFSEPRMKQLDYLIHALAQRGIYIYLDLLVTRNFRVGDGVRDWEKLEWGYLKFVALFDPRIIELQKEYARALLTRVNTVTGLRYADDPSIVLTDIVNENNLYDFNHYDQMPESYRRDFDRLHAAWRIERGIPADTRDVGELLRARDRETVRFVMEMQQRFDDDMERFLREECGVKFPICGSNWWGPVAEVVTSARLDFIDEHGYWDHPQNGWTEKDTFINKAHVEELSGLLPRLARQRVAGLPFFVSEWNYCWPNDWAAEGPVLTATIAVSQGWNGLTQFAGNAARWESEMKGAFETLDKPHVVTALPAASLIYLRGDLEPAAAAVFPVERDRFEQSPPDIGVSDMLKHRVSLLLVDQPGEVQREEPRATGYRWRQRLFTLESARAQGLIGFPEGEAVALPALEIRLANIFAQITAVSLDDRALKESGRWLLSASARAENTGQRHRAGRTGLEEVGTGPILLEPVHATVLLPAGPRPTVNVIDWYQRRTGEVLPVYGEEDGRWRVELGSVPAQWFEVVFPR